MLLRIDIFLSSRRNAHTKGRVTCLRTCNASKQRAFGLLFLVSALGVFLTNRGKKLDWVLSQHIPITVVCRAGTRPEGLLRWRNF